MRKKILLIISTIVLVSSVMLSMPAVKGTAELKISGDIKMDIPQARVNMSYMKRIKIWYIQIHTPSVEYKKNGKKGTANLFFSRNFDLKTGTYPIAFSYLNKKDIMGGTFMYREVKKRTNRFTYDTEGKITFTKVGDIIEGSFSFSVYSDKEHIQSVKVSGKFSVPRKKSFPGVPLK